MDSYYNSQLTLSKQVASPALMHLYTESERHRWPVRVGIITNDYLVLLRARMLQG